MSDWRNTAEWTWVTVGDADALHAVATEPADADEDWGGEGTTACGQAGWLAIPGIFSRMGEVRCAECCTRTGMPAGSQSPKNDDRCRPVVEGRLAALPPAAA